MVAATGQTPRRRERGQALLLTLFVMLLTMATMALLASSLRGRMWQVQQLGRGIKLTAMTDAGIAMMLANLSRNASYGGADAIPFGGGLLSIKVERTGYEQGRGTVGATYLGSRRVVQVELRLRAGALPEVLSWQPLATPLGSGIPRGPS